MSDRVFSISLTLGLFAIFLNVLPGPALLVALAIPGLVVWWLLFLCISIFTCHRLRDRETDDGDST